MFTRSLVAAALLCSASVVAHADTLLLGSYGTGAASSGAANTSVTYGATGTTYNVPTGGVWHDPLGTSSWVSFGPNNYPGGGVQATDGSYTYLTTFSGTDFSSGSLSVLADDTVSIFLNGNLVGAAATADPSVHCTVSTRTASPRSPSTCSAPTSLTAPTP